MVIRAPSPGLLWGGRTQKTHSLGHHCPPIVIGKSFSSAGRSSFLYRWHWSIHHGFVPWITPWAHQGSTERSIYHPAWRNREWREEMHISPQVFLQPYNGLTHFHMCLILPPLLLLMQETRNSIRTSCKKLHTLRLKKNDLHFVGFKNIKVCEVSRTSVRLFHGLEENSGLIGCKESIKSDIPWSGWILDSDWLVGVD